MESRAEQDVAPVREGDVVAGKYRIERQIGSGGMGVVVAARHLALGEPVALKFVLAHRVGSREAVERTKREARATFRLRNPHTLRTFDVDELPSGDLYIVMELLDGRDLRAELRERGPLPEGEVVGWMLQACEALEEAHAAGIVHRDLKPHNLFLAKGARGEVSIKVLDFGTSKLDPDEFDSSGPLTRPNTAIGTPRYMAPEQWQSSAEVDARADIWALGVVMYELLTGHGPLQGMEAHERQARLLAGAIPSPRELRPGLSDAVAKAVLRCLRPDLGARWPTVAHLATALRDAHPNLLPKVARAEVPRSGLTAMLSEEQVAQHAARAFAHVPSPTSSPTRAETPLAIVTSPGGRASSVDSLTRDVASARPAEFNAETEVRPPVFVGDEAPQQAKDAKKAVATLQSAMSEEALALRARHAHIEPSFQDRTEPMPGRPMRNAEPPPAAFEVRTQFMPMHPPAAVHASGVAAPKRSRGLTVLVVVALAVLVLAALAVFAARTGAR